MRNFQLKQFVDNGKISLEQYFEHIVNSPDAQSLRIEYCTPYDCAVREFATDQHIRIDNKIYEELTASEVFSVVIDEFNKIEDANKDLERKNSLMRGRVSELENALRIIKEV